MSRQHQQLSAATQAAIREVARQLGCGAEEALYRLEQRAKFGQYRLHDYSRLVVDGIIRFAPDPRTTVAD